MRRAARARRRLLAVAVATAAALQLPALVSPQDPQRPSFPTETELVTVDVVVTGRNGEPVTDLRREDFAVTEDGAPQAIASFEAVHRPALTPAAAATRPAPPEPRTATNQLVPGREPASFVVVFDELHLTPAEAVRARNAVAAFLESAVAAGDRVGLVGTSQGTRVTAQVPEGRDALVQFLGRLQGRNIGESVRSYINDYEAMRIDQDRDPIVTDEVMRRLLASGEIRRDVGTRENVVNEQEELPFWREETRARAAAVYSRARQRLEQTLGIVERSLASLATARGRKSLVLVSAGLHQDGRVAAFRGVVSESRRANAPVYSLDVRGLVAATTGLQADVSQPLDIRDRATGAGLAETADAAAGSEGLALDTGGFVIKNQNDLASGLARVSREARSYYLIGYAPSNRAADGRFRKIAVAVAREDVLVRARRGYYAAGPGPAKPPAEGRDAAMQRALDAPFDLAELPLRGLALAFGAAEPGKTRMLLAVEADVRGLAFADAGGTARDTLECLLLVAHRETGEFTRFDQQLQLQLSPESRARYERDWFPITRELPLAPGPYQAKIVARDKNSGRLGSLTWDFEVPAASGLRVSSLVLSDRLREDAAGASRVPEPRARRSFLPSGVLHCRFEVYGAAKDAASGGPNVLAGFALRRSDGRVLAAMPETKVQPSPDGSLARSLGVPLDGAAPGRYELIVVVTDVAGGQSAEAREPIEIESPLPEGDGAAAR
jgi:VWFA-related protein